MSCPRFLCFVFLPSEQLCLFAVMNQETWEMSDMSLIAQSGIIPVAGWERKLRCSSTVVSKVIDLAVKYIWVAKQKMYLPHILRKSSSSELNSAIALHDSLHWFRISSCYFRIATLGQIFHNSTIPQGLIEIF